MSPVGARIETESGFSLLELVISLAVIAAVGLVVLPQVGGWTGRAGPEAQARRLIGAVAWARSEAVTTGRKLVMRFENGGRRFIFMSGEDEVDKLDLDESVKVDGYQIRGAAADRPAQVDFTADGRVTEAVIYLKADDRVVTLHLEPLTGRVEARAGRIGYDFKT